MGAIGATPGGARQPEVDSSGPEVDRAQAGAPGTALIHTGLGGPADLNRDYYETIMRLKHQTIIDYYETIAGILLELLGILLGILPDLLGFTGNIRE